MFEPPCSQRKKSLSIEDVPCKERCILLGMQFLTTTSNTLIGLLQQKWAAQSAKTEPKENVATKIQQISANFAFLFVQPCTFYMLFHLGPSWCYPFLLPCDPRTRQIKFVDDFKGRVTFLSTLPLWSQCTFSQSFPRKWWLQMDDSKTRVFFLRAILGVNNCGTPMDKWSPTKWHKMMRNA